MIKHLYCSSCNVPVILVRFLIENLIFATDCRENIQISNFMKISPVSGSPVVPRGHKDIHIDMTKFIVFFRKFSNDPNKSLLRSLHAGMEGAVELKSHILKIGFRWR
jgi:hypothetical protein